MNLITYLIENKLAKNEPHANAKIALLHLQDICDDEAAVIARVQLYEAHKASKLHGKKDRAICAEMAIKGEPVPVPVVEMFAKVDEMVICPVCETTHRPEEIELLESGVDDDVTWEEYRCLRTGETWTHLSHAAIPDGEPVPAPVVDMFAELPQIGDVYEFDYVYNERGKTTERLIVVDVTDTHVMYKMPGVSVNKIFPMDHDTWKANTDERRKVKTLNDISYVDAWTYSSDKGEAVIE